MKILIATPIHKVKDYAMERWLTCVAHLQQAYPADVLMIDNSIGLEYMEKVEGYCKKLGIKNYRIMHLELPPIQERFERIARSREIIRTEFLAGDYDAWFSWENDILIPPDALGKLVTLLEAGNFMTVDHNCWMRGFGSHCTDFGICLVTREALEKYSFLFEFGTDPEMPDTYEPSEVWFKRRILRDGGGCAEVQQLIDPVVHLHVDNPHKMKVLIGTPVHISKDYSMERWLENVSKLQILYPADVFIVDNSPGLEYVKKVKEYCNTYGVKNYKIEHLELPPEQEKHERIARSREVIRTFFLSKDYDAWFTWECDQIIPIETLYELVEISNSDNYMMVNPNKWAREDPTIPNTDFGCCLIRREALEKYGFILAFGTDPETPTTWESGEAWFKTRVLRGGDTYIDIYGIINPIYHLNQ